MSRKKRWYHVTEALTFLLCAAAALCAGVALFSGSLGHDATDMTSTDVWLLSGMLALLLVALACWIASIELKADLLASGELEERYDFG